MPIGSNSVRSAKSDGEPPVAALEDRGQGLDRRVVVRPGLAGRDVLAETDGEGVLVGGAEQLAVVDPQAPLPTRVVAEQLLDRDVGRRRARPLGDEVGRGLGDVDVALVLGDAHEGGRDRLRDRERLGGDVGRAAAEVALVDDGPVAGHDQAGRAAGLGRCRQAVERRGVEAGLGRVDVVPVVAREAHALVAGRPGRVAVGRRPTSCCLAVAARRAGGRDERQRPVRPRPDGGAAPRRLVPRIPLV